MKRNTMDKQQIYAQEEWNKGYENYHFFVAPHEDKMRQWLEKHIPKDKKEVIEIGCFPGRYLAVFGEKGYVLNGIDLTPEVSKSLISWFRSNNYKIGEFFQIDFLKDKIENAFEIVTSYGFIEHFTNWEDVITKHANLVKNDGYLIMSTPNFRGVIQRFLHSNFDRVNYSKHVIASMNPKKWKEILMKQGFEIIFSGYFGGFNFWHCWQGRPYIQRFFLYRFMKIVPFLNRKIKHNHPSYSPFCGIVAKKIS